MKRFIIDAEIAGATDLTEGPSSAGSPAVTPLGRAPTDLRRARVVRGSSVARMEPSASPGTNVHVGAVREAAGHRQRAYQPATGAPIGHMPLGTVLAVWAHPDDESFVAGGLLAAASDAGSRIVCLTATRGERGTADPDRWHPARLARTRARELAAAHTVLGIDEQRWLPFHDGACDTVSPGHGMALVADVIADVQPDTIVTFGPDGLTGHTDHQAVSHWTSQAWAAGGCGARLLWATITADTKRRMADAEPVARAFYPGYPSVAPDHRVAIRLDLTADRLDRKFTAIRAHATQSAALVHRLGEDRFRRWWATETYLDVGAADPVAPDDRTHASVRTTSLHRAHAGRDRRFETDPHPRVALEMA